MQNKGKPLIIFDTDMDTDCDDAGALALLYECVKRDKAKLLGVITDSVSPYAAACCDAMGIFYGIDVAIGAVSSQLCPEGDRFKAYRAHSNNISTSGHNYNRMMADRIQKRDTDYQDAVSLYRRILAEAQDKSITVVCVGLLTAVAAAILSREDAISPFTGVELFEKKVCKVICMGYTDSAGPNFNWDMDKMAAKAFFEHCPVSVYASPAGGNIITGASLSNRLQVEHPLRQIYEIYNGPNKGRPSWDLIAALYAVEPESPLFAIKEKGMCRYDGSKSYWESYGKRCDYELTVNVSTKEMEDYLEMHMTGDF